MPNPEQFEPKIEKESSESKKERIIKKNLELMLGREKGQMIKLLLGESIGGNAGTFESFPCAGANFSYDKTTGEIIEFANIQEREIKNKELGEGTFRVAVNLKRENPFFKIVDYYFEKDTSPQAKNNLEESVKRYNEIMEGQKLEQKKEELDIKEAKSFSQLYQVLNKKGEIIGSRRIRYSSELLINTIDKLRKNLNELKEAGLDFGKINEDKLKETEFWKSQLNEITRSEGLREKVSELLIKELKETNKEKEK